MNVFDVCVTAVKADAIATASFRVRSVCRLLQLTFTLVPFVHIR